MLYTSTSDTLKRASGEIHTCDATIDTLELFFPRLRNQEQFKALASCLPDRDCEGEGWFTKCKDK